MRKGAVLILGNGISRLLFAREIEAWRGEMWACNLAYVEFGPRLDRLTGHAAVLMDAARAKESHGYRYEIWGGNLAQQTCPGLKLDKTFTCPGELQKDSGTTLVAQALHEGRREVNAVGFDLGGPDVLSPNLQRQDKMCWVMRWRRIAEEYTLDDVTFWGHNHKPYILGDLSPQEYSRLYRRGVPHIQDDDYVAIWEKHTGEKARLSGGNSWDMVECEVRGQAKLVVFRRDVAEVFERRGSLRIVRTIRQEAKV